MNHRAQQVVSLIRRAVQVVIGRGLHDPRVRGLISVTKVVMDDDLSQATVYVSVLPQEHAALTRGKDAGRSNWNINEFSFSH